MIKDLKWKIRLFIITVKYDYKSWKLNREIKKDGGKR
jgi:hypothetical protein